MVEDDLVHLHTHCHTSAFDGLGKPEEFCQKAAELGQSAISLTDHGSLRGLYEASVAADSAGIKLIPGAELYLVDDASKKGLTDEEKADAKAFAEVWGLDPKEELKRRLKERTDRDHVTVWAMNDVGLRNLYRLTALSWTSGFWHKPRTDIETLCQHSEGLAVSSGCPNGVVAKLLRRRDGVSEAVSRAKRLAEVFGDRFLVEIMPHVPEEDCVGLAEKLVKLADRFGATLIATQDAHYPHESDAPAQEALLCIHTRSKMADPDRFSFDERDYWLKTRPELEQAFVDKLPGIHRRIWSKAMDATVAFADRCSAKVARPKAGAYLVAPPLPDGIPDYDRWLVKLCSVGSFDRFAGPLSTLGGDYQNRLRHELKIVRDLGFARYFAAVWEVRSWARSQGILCGPGRGSGAGSLICYLLRITDLDPLKHGLMFERFLAPGRVDLPDIDCFSPDQRVLTVDGWKPIGGIKPGDSVLTRKGPRFVKAVHYRRHSGQMVRLRGTYRGVDLDLLLTPNHRMILPKGGGCYERSIRCVPGTRAWALGEGLCDLRGGLLVPQVKQTTDLFSSVRSGETGQSGLVVGPSRPALGSAGSDVPVGFGGGFCPLGGAHEPGGSVRTGDVFSPLWREVHPGLLHPESISVRRAERLGSEPGEARSDPLVHGDCRQDPQGHFSARISRDPPKHSRSRSPRNGGDDLDCEVGKFQDGGKRLLPMWEGILGADQEEDEVLFSRLREHGRRFGFSEELSTRKDGVQMLHLWRNVDALFVGPEPEILFSGLLRGIDEVEIAEYSVEEYDGIVINLSIEGDRHEYFAEGFLVANCDFESTRRGEIVQHLQDTYGVENVAHISTHNLLGGKQTAADLARIFDVPRSEIMPISAMISEGYEEEAKTEESFARILEETEPGKEFASRYPDLASVARRLEGQLRGVGLHAAGIVMSPVPLADIVPIESRAPGGGEEGRVQAIAYDMKGVEAQGLVKLDILGLTTLSMLQTAFLSSGRTPEEIDLEDQKVLAYFTASKLAGVFQYDTPSARRLAAGYKFKAFADVAVMTALNRPGPAKSGLSRQFMQRSIDPAKIPSIHPIYDEIMGETFGVPVYQEQVISLAKGFGYSAEDADKLRKKIGKKLGLSDEEGRFVGGAMAVGMSADAALALWKDILGFAAYGFNRCLSGETKLLRAGVNIHSSQGDFTIRRLFEAQSERTSWGEKIRAGRTRILQMDEDGRLRPGYVKAIYSNGVKPVFRITLASGQQVKATAEHRFLTPAGYSRVSDLRPGMSLVVIAKEVKERKGYAVRGVGSTYSGKGTPSGSLNPGWLDGRSVAFDLARQEVLERARGSCEVCGRPEFGRFEFAHTLSLENCSGDFSRYHSAENIRRLCNSCHKSFDYEKEERKPAWSKGKATEISEIVSIEAVGEEETFDIEMNTVGHNFMAEGIVSHNSHSFCYGALAVWGMWLKVYHPGDFYAAAMSFETDPGAQMRLAAEARAEGFPVRPPDVNLSGSGFRFHAGEIAGSISDLKGIGEKTAEVVASGAPYASLLDFYQRTAGAGKRLSTKTFAVLSAAGAFRSIFPNVKFLAENSAIVWSRLKNGFAPELSPGLPDYTDDELAETAGSVWPLAVSLSGHTAFEAVLQKLRATSKREVFVPGDEELTTPGCRLVLALLSRYQTFPDEDGKSSARVMICSSEGVELSARVDTDVIDSSAEAFVTVNRPIVLFLSTGERGGLAVERAWSLGAFGEGEALAGKTRPKDLARAIQVSEDGETVALQGQLLRGRVHRDKNERKMMTLTIASELGAAKVLVFSGRMKADISTLAIGDRIAFKVKKLDGRAACLADAPIEFL